MAQKKKSSSISTRKDKAALYIRVSTVYQIDKDSLKVQERELSNYTKLVLNIKDYEIFRDAGYSAKNTDRPDYQKMMRKLRTGEFSHLVVWKIDRISRNLLDFAEMYAELKDLGVAFISKNEQFDTSSAIGEAMLKIILVFAELERQMTSERVTAVMISRAESGSWNGGKVPLGYVYHKETKSFSIHPEQAEVVKLIYDSYERMQSSTAVAKFLNQKGITTKAGRKWNPSTVCLFFRNPVYKGTMVYNKRRISVAGKLKPEDEWITVDNHHAAIIDAEQFERCHALLKRNMIGSDRSTYFRGNCHVLASLLYCDYCGSMMAAQIGKPLKSKGGIIPSNYSRYNKRHGLCENPFTSDSIIGPFILNYVSNMYRIQKTFGKSTSIETLENKLLRGEAFKEVAHIKTAGLNQLYQALKTQVFSETPVYYEPNLPEHEATPDQKAIYLGEKSSHERALSRLHQLFMYADSDMSEAEYFEEKSKLEVKLDAVNQKLSALESEEVSDVTSEYFTALVSNFILEPNAISGRDVLLPSSFRTAMNIALFTRTRRCRKMDKVAIYIRVSTVMQLDKESRGVQRNDLIRYCNDILGIPDYEIFEDAGFSAGSTDRPDYQKMMQHIRAGEITHLLVWKIDRISRNIIDFTDMYQELQALGITFISLAEQFDTSSIVGQALLKMILIFAELERHNAAERSKAVLLSKAQVGEYTGFRIPFGYRRDSDTKEYSIEESEANIIRLIFDMFDQGTTVYTIAKHLNSLPLKERVKEKWQMPTIERMLTNISYTGALRYNYRSYTSKKERVINDGKDLVFVENDHPVIITKEQFERCQQQYAERKDTVYHVRKPLFADLMVCNVHQIPLSWQKENKRKFSSPATYSCPYCSQSSFTDNEIGSFVMNYILNLLQAYGQVSPSTSSITLKRMLLRGKEFDGITALVNAEEIKHSLLGDTSAKEDVQYKRKELKFELLKKERELERLEPYGTDPSDVPNVQIDQLKSTIEKLSVELQQLENTVGTQSIPQVDYLKKCYDFYNQRNLYYLSDIDFSDCFKNISFYDLKHFLQDVIEEISVKDGRIIAIEFCTDQEKGKTQNFS